jgi:DNA-binding LacI/PurR family transcriptional regulator
MGYATLEDIARKVNKSVATVSRVLNGKDREGIRISPKTREKILSLAKELNYHPNYLARHLVKKDSRVIGLLVPDVLQVFFNEITYHLSRELDARGYDLLLAHSYEEAQPESKAIRMILSRRVNGIIVAPAMGQMNLELLESIRIPLILLDRYFRGKSFHTVTSDDVSGSRALVEHLLAQGVRRILFICGNTSTSVSLERLEGYRGALLAGGLPVEEALIRECGYFREDGYTVTRRLAEEGLLRGVEAVMGVNDEVALGAMEALWENGLRVPEDILVAGYGDERYSKYLRVPLTSVRQPTDELAREACSMLMDLIEGRQPPRRNVKVPCSLVVRRSTQRGEEA